VEEVVRPDTLPPPLGGAITPGTYVLNELNRYGGSDAGPAVAARATLYVTANTMTWIESRGPANALPNDQTRGGTFTAAGTTISLELACPQAGVATTIGYSAVGAGLALNVSATSREVYVKQ
jgi:hypothetical protein